MSDCYIGGEIAVYPVPPLEKLTGSRFDPATTGALLDVGQAPEVVVRAGCDNTAALVVPVHRDRLTTAPPGQVRADLSELVALLGAGFTYHGQLRIDQPNGDPPTRLRMAKVAGAWKVQQHDAEYVYPADYKVPSGPAVVFDPAAARAWLAGTVCGSLSRALARYRIDPTGAYGHDDRLGDWLCRLMLDLDAGAAPHVWRQADGVTVEVVETLDADDQAGSRASTVADLAGPWPAPRPAAPAHRAAPRLRLPTRTPWGPTILSIMDSACRGWVRPAHLTVRPGHPAGIAPGSPGRQPGTG